MAGYDFSNYSGLMLGDHVVGNSAVDDLVADFFNIVVDIDEK